MDIFFTESELDKVDAFLHGDKVLIDNDFDFANFDKKCIKNIGITLPTMIFTKGSYPDNTTYHAKVIDKEKFFIVVMRHEFNFRYEL